MLRWTTCPGTLRPFNSFLILLNLDKDVSPEQLVTMKLRNEALRGWINLEPLIWGIRPKRAFVIFCCFPVSRKRSAVASWQSLAKSYSSLAKSSLIFLAWDQYELAQVLSSNLISESLCRRKLKSKKITSKNTNRALRDTNAHKTTVLLNT